MNPRFSLLVAEDDEDDFSFLKEVLNEASPDFEIFWVKNGEELMAHLRDFPSGGVRPEVLLLDLNMPKKDGRQALDEIKRDEALKNLFVIVFTTSNSELDRRYVEAFEKTLFVTKPIGYTNYLAFAQSLLRMRALDFK